MDTSSSLFMFASSTQRWKTNKIYKCFFMFHEASTARVCDCLETCWFLNSIKWHRHCFFLFGNLLTIMFQYFLWRFALQISPIVAHLTVKMFLHCAKPSVFFLSSSNLWSLTSLYVAAQPFPYSCQISREATLKCCNYESRISRKMLFIITKFNEVKSA